MTLAKSLIPLNEQWPEVQLHLEKLCLHLPRLHEQSELTNAMHFNCKLNQSGSAQSQTQYLPMDDSLLAVQQIPISR